jgi:hypothetical protein
VPVGVVPQQVADGAPGDLPLDLSALGKDRIVGHDGLPAQTAWPTTMTRLHRNYQIEL